ncbi:hypothetical protein [Meiothermus cerbereus]|uniref:hypothetical protein n=1 Tax=Meiothermus cerbereus TaxID=65552 RepID=UPI003EED6D9E
MRIIRYDGKGGILAELEWRGPGDYKVISGQLDEDGQDILETVSDLPHFIDGYVNTVDAYQDEPYFGWPEEEEDEL